MISNAYAEDLLKLTFNGTAIANIADNASSSPLTKIYISLHTQDPGAAGNQGSHEVSYTGYQRASPDRSGSGFTVTGSEVSPTSEIDFPEMSGGSQEVATHVGIGVQLSGAGKILFRLELDTPITLTSGTQPRLRTTTKLTAVTSD